MTSFTPTSYQTNALIERIRALEQKANYLQQENNALRNNINNNYAQNLQNQAAIASQYANSPQSYLSKIDQEELEKRAEFYRQRIMGMSPWIDSGKADRVVVKPKPEAKTDKELLNTLKSLI